MTNASDRGEAGAELWVVDVTAPLATGRVHEVAADAAARLKLPVEKLIALLENRIGPVTKPLPHASAARVAEVLNLSGADVNLRPAEPNDEPAAMPSEPAGDVVLDDARPPENGGAPETIDEPPREHERGDPPDEATDDVAATASEPSVSRPTPPPPAPEDRPPKDLPPKDLPPASRPRSERASTSDDPWGALDDDDDAMLGGWHRAPASTVVNDAPTGPRTQSDANDVPASRAVKAATASHDRRPIADRPPTQEIEDEDETAWSYGLRDPFAEADARERTLRRWVLMIALLIASTIFVALQWAYSRTEVDERGVASFDQGLTAYRDGAFVSAARAWTPLAESGDPEAMFMLGWMAEFGQGRAWSNSEAASWYRQAAERGQSAAQLRLGDLYRRGLGVDQDLATALHWYLAAAEAGVPRAQREAALVLARFERLDEARVWLERAARTDPDAAAWWSLANEGDGATEVSP